MNMNAIYCIGILNISSKFDMQIITLKHE